MDVHMADVQVAVVQCDPQPERTRGLPSFAPGGAYRLSRHGSCSHGGRERTADADQFGCTACRPGGATGQCGSPGHRSSGGEAVGAGYVPAGDAYYQAPAAGLRQRTCTILRELLLHHTLCHHQWTKRRYSESFQAEVAAARWAWLGPTLLVRAHEGSDHADDEGMTPGMRRKLSIELAGKRATLAETGAWTDLLRMYVRDLLSYEVDARGDGAHTLQQSTTLKADTMRASDKMDSCNFQAALQILQTSVRAPQNTQTGTDDHEIARIRMQMCSGQAGCCEIHVPTSEVGETNGQEGCAGGRARSQWVAQC